MGLTAKQEWEAAFGDRAIEVLENENSDLGYALAAALEWLGLAETGGYIGEYFVYIACDGSAAAIRVDVDGDRRRLPSRAEEFRKQE